MTTEEKLQVAEQLVRLNVDIIEAGFPAASPGDLEAVKEIVGIGESLSGSMLIYDALEMSFRRTRIPKDPTCPMCGPNPRIKDLSADYAVSCSL